MKWYEQHRISYDRIAAEYAARNADMVPAVLSSAELFISYLGDGSNILDVGCGHGRETKWFASRGYRAVGFDLSGGLLRETRRCAQLPLVQGNMMRLPFAERQYDAIWCNAAFLHIPKSQSHVCLLEFKRVLKKPGLLYLALQAGSGEVCENQSYGVETSRFFARYSLEEAAQMLQSAGYRVLEQIENKQGPRSHWLHYFAWKISR